MANPVRALKQHLPNRKLQPPVPVFRHVPDHGHRLAVRRPVRILDTVQHFAWSSSAHRNPRQRSRLHPPAQVYRVEPHRQLSALRNRQQFCILQPQFARSGIVRPPHIELVVSSVPRRAVDKTAVRSESCIPNRARAKRYRSILRQRSLPAASSPPPAHAQHQSRQRQCARQCSPFAPPGNILLLCCRCERASIRNRRLPARSARRRTVRQRLQIERQIPR